MRIKAHKFDELQEKAKEVGNEIASKDKSIRRFKDERIEILQPGLALQMNILL